MSTYYTNSIDNGSASEMYLADEELLELKRRLDAEFSEPQIDTSNDCCEENLRKHRIKWVEAKVRIQEEIIKARINQ